MKSIYIIVISFYLTNLSALANTTNELTYVENIKNLALAPLPLPPIDFNEIISKNKKINIGILDVYAWSKIFEGTNENSRSLVNYIINILTPEKQADAAKRYKILIKEINNGKYKNKRLYPSKIFFKEKKAEFEIIPITTIAPIYPRVARIAKLQGYVNVDFNVYPDGSARDIHVSNEYPKRIFSKAAVQAISKYHFKIKWGSNNTVSKFVQATTQRVEFKLTGNLPIISNEQIKQANEQFELAQEGVIKSQHDFTTTYKTLPINFNNEIVKLKQVNDWLYNAASKGFSDSQHYLGLAIFYGIGCLKEEQKGFDWFVKSAKQGYVNAQMSLYNLINLGTLNNTSMQSASFWLESAAKNGSTNAKLVFAKILLDVEDIDTIKIKLALSYLDDYAESYGELPQYYHIKALLLSKMGERSQAKRSINKAIKLAKKSGWELTELENDKKMIKKNKTK